MNIADEGFVDRPVPGELRNPQVGRQGRRRLLLRPRLELSGGLAHRGVQLLFRELGPLDPRRSRNLAFELDFLELVGPAPLVRYLGEGQDGGLGRGQIREQSLEIVAEPVRWKLVSDDGGRLWIRTHFHLISYCQIVSSR